MTAAVLPDASPVPELPPGPVAGVLPEAAWSPPPEVDPVTRRDLAEVVAALSRRLGMRTSGWWLLGAAVVLYSLKAGWVDGSLRPVMHRGAAAQVGGGGVGCRIGDAGSTRSARSGLLLLHRGETPGQLDLPLGVAVGRCPRVLGQHAGLLSTAEAQQGVGIQGLHAGFG